MISKFLQISKNIQDKIFISLIIFSYIFYIVIARNNNIIEQFLCSWYDLPCHTRAVKERILVAARVVAERVKRTARVLAARIRETARVLAARIGEITRTLAARIGETTRALVERIWETAKVVAARINTVAIKAKKNAETMKPNNIINSVLKKVLVDNPIMISLTKLIDITLKPIIDRIISLLDSLNNKAKELFNKGIENQIIPIMNNIRKIFGMELLEYEDYENVEYIENNKTEEYYENINKIVEKMTK